MPMDLDENITPGFKFLREKINEKNGDTSGDMDFA